MVVSTNIYAQQSLPVSYPEGTLVNYVRTLTATAPEQDPVALKLRQFKDVKQSTQYLDGLGRPIQTVIKQGSLNTATGANVDMISAVTYDAYGREQFKYLPFASTATDVTKNGGGFILNPFPQQVSFYNKQLSGQAGETNLGSNGLNYAYSQTVFEASPLNRVQESFAPGVNWAGTANNVAETDRKSVKAKYYLNTDVDAVRIWTVSNAARSVFGSYTTASGTAGIYGAGQLYKSISADEKNNQVIEFKDKEGKVILKKVQLTATPDNGSGSGYAKWLCTYYIYDDLNQLRCVIQPGGVNSILSNWLLTDETILAGQCFRYEYDGRQRMIMKKVPGAGESYMVYDALDRLVMTQDANLRLSQNNKWMITLYDALNRPSQTGLLLNTFSNNSFTAHLNAAAVSSAYPFAASSTPSATYWEQLTQTFYDDYEWLAAEGNPVPKNRDTGNDNYFPSIPASKYPEPYVQSFQTKGMVTGSKTKVIGSSQYLYTGIYYDKKGRVLGTYTQALNQGTIVINNLYNFSGQLLCSDQTTISNGQGTAIPTLYDYDDLGRLLTIRKTMWTTYDIFVPEKILVNNQYDALGQLKTKILAPTSMTDNKGLEAAKYDYNIRGWLLGMNRDYVNDGNTTNYFGFDLGYDKSGFIGTYTPQYNGNISGTIWKSKGDQQKRKYDFAYDGVNRLLKADFTQQSGTAWDLSAKVDFSMKMGNGTDPLSAYDANGNIKGMYQMGLKGSASVAVDDLSYNYLPNSNQLNYVTDAVNSVGTKLGDFQESVQNRTDNTNGAADYAYDANGNLSVDNNKAISSITYNYLNLPSVITMTGKGTITYTYDAGGIKIRKETKELPSSLNKNITTTTTTDYIGGSVYESKSDNDPLTVDYANRLQFTGQEEGRIRAVYGTSQKPDSITSFAFDYFLKDHLGNVRMVLTDERQVDRYPTATLEANAVKQEQQFYGIDTNYVVKAPSTAPLYLNDNGFNNPNTYGTPTANSQKMYQLNGSTNKTGLSTILKVMTGDSINIYAKSYYHYSGTASNSALSASELITSFLGSGGSSGNPASIHGATVAGLNANTAGTFNPLNLFSNSNPVNPTNNVKAGINYIIFDEQFNYVSGSFDPVNTGTKDSVKTHILQNIVMPKNGYIYIYCSNESNINVFFDNLEVKQTRGPILEETHYYPFGLAIAGISSKAAGKLLNKYGITCKERQSQEFSDGSGLEEYDFGARFYDHQIGRFSSIDPHIANYYWLSPYSYCNNNPIKYLDPSGMDPETSTSEKPKDLSNVTIVAHKKANNSLANRGFGWANNASTSGAKHTMNQQQAYQQARGNGFSQTELTNSWRKQGINDRELDRFERGYKSEVDYRNMSLIAIGSIGAPILAIGGIETGLASYLIIGSDLSWKARFSIGVFDAGYQYINTGKINPVQTALSSIGPLSYALAANTTFDIHQSQPLGINPDATFGSIFISTGFNMLGGAGVDVFDQNGAGAASGAISLIPGIWNDGFNDLTK